jgi:hypothetical protein
MKVINRQMSEKKFKIETFYEKVSIKSDKKPKQKNCRQFVSCYSHKAYESVVVVLL